MIQGILVLEKPVEPARLQDPPERAIRLQEKPAVETETHLKRELSLHGVLGDLGGNSAPMQQIFFHHPQEARPHRRPYDLRREWHREESWCAGRSISAAPRADGPFVAINCRPPLRRTLVESELFGPREGRVYGSHGAFGHRVVFERLTGHAAARWIPGETLLASTQPKLLRRARGLARAGGRR